MKTPNEIIQCPHLNIDPYLLACVDCGASRRERMEAGQVERPENANYSLRMGSKNAAATPSDIDPWTGKPCNERLGTYLNGDLIRRGGDPHPVIGDQMRSRFVNDVVFNGMVHRMIDAHQAGQFTFDDFRAAADFAESCAAERATRISLEESIPNP